MTIINVGSLNIDHVYTVDHFVRPGETLHSWLLERHPGGKGLNQSIALARAGVSVQHVGFVGDEGEHLTQVLADNHVDVQWMRKISGANGHSIIQVRPDGQNSIVLYGGSNMKFDLQHIEAAMASAQPTDIVLLQNEINHLPQVIECAKRYGLRVVFNAAPASDAVLNYPLHLIDLLIINEIEGLELTGKRNPTEICEQLIAHYPTTAVLLTLGAEGALYMDARETVSVPAEFVSQVIDTTAAGDTFIGYFLGGWLKNAPIVRCLQLACRASALCIQRKGSSTAIPYPHEVAGYAEIFETAAIN